MLFGEGPQIKNIAADLNKLFRQGSLLNQSVQTVEGDSTADQGTRDLLAARDPVIQEISVGMSGEQSARYTVSGTPPLSLPNSLGKPLKAWSVDLLPYQEGTGDPAPDNVRTIYGTDKLNLFVEESYDQSATPKAVINVPPLSANQWDEEWRNGYYNVHTGAFITASAYFANKNPIKVKPNTSYYIGSSVNATWEVFYYDSDMAYLSYDTKTNTTFTTPSNCAYINFSGATTFYGNTYNHDIAINYPSTVTTYNPYNATVYTGTIGSEGGESRWGVVDLGALNWAYITNRTNPYFRATIPEMKSVYSNAGNTNVMCEGFTIYIGTALLNTADLNSGFNCTSWEMGGNNHDVGIVWKDYTTVTDFTTAVTGMKLIFELTEPTTIPITTPTIPTPTGTATTWATAEDGTADSMEVTYVGKT